MASTTKPGGSNTKLLVVGIVAVIALGGGTLAALLWSGTSEPTSHAHDGATGHPHEARVRGDYLLARREDGAPVSGEAINRLRRTPGVERVERYLTGTLEDGTPVVGLAPLTAPLRSPGGELLSPRLAAGRSLTDVQAEGGVAIVGLAWAQSHETIYGFEVAGMITSHPAPVQLTDEAQVTVVDVADTGDDEADQAIFVPFEVAERLLGKAGELSWVALRLDDGANLEEATRAVEDAGLQVVSR